MSAATAEPGQAAEQPSEKGTQISKVWVPVILILAVLLGLALAETIPSPVCPPWISGPCPWPYFYLLSVHGALMLHVILSTIEIVLLVSLVAVYIKVYADTRANFSLGLIIVLGALAVHSFLSYPLVVNDVESILYGSLFFPYTDLLTIIAYSVFLYLSLE
ncbi:MAG: hypothetical protein ABSB56_03095 [Nitrososphaerales archaeon]|jgi:hypothetical protein